jgi:hypothetical protein
VQERRAYMNQFKEINFRYTDAGEEILYAPELIEHAYVDINGILEDIKLPEKYLVIGPKGSGKTALASKLKLVSKIHWNMFVENDELEQFEFALLSKCGAKKGTSIGGALTVWQLLLSIRMISLFLNDEKFKDLNNNILRFHDLLIEHGLAESNSLISISQYTSRRGVFSNIKNAVFEVGGQKSEEKNYKIKDPAALLSSIKTVLRKMIVADSSYYLVLDGLDHILRQGRNNAPYIADLINAAKQFNQFLSECGIKAKIVILIRNEVIQIVPDPNLAKRINDNGVQIKWSDNTRVPFNSSLMQIVEKRAEMVGYSCCTKDLWEKWFPQYINGSDSLNFVLLNTRFLPRDLISFFREVQALEKEPPFSKSDVLTALTNYSDWFLQELLDALVGLVEEKLRTELPDIISTLSRKFSLSSFKEILKEYGYSSTIAEQVARELFNASWIGNIWIIEEGHNRYNWKHRKLNAKLILQYDMIVHPGLYKTLNLI